MCHTLLCSVISSHPEWGDLSRILTGHIGALSTLLAPALLQSSCRDIHQGKWDVLHSWGRHCLWERSKHHRDRPQEMLTSLIFLLYCFSIFIHNASLMYHWRCNVFQVNFLGRWRAESLTEWKCRNLETCAGVFQQKVLFNIWIIPVIYISLLQKASVANHSTGVISVGFLLEISPYWCQQGILGKLINLIIHYHAKWDLFLKGGLKEVKL